jgi:aspartyl-tRNA synthetase
MGEEQPLRTDYAGQLTSDRIGDRVRLAGWVDRRRDHGRIVFFDLRDASGLVQVVVDPDELPAASDLKMEYTVAIAGEVRHRPAGTTNPEMETGEVEVAAAEIAILSTADTLPFMINDRIDVDERIRLQYRYLDLRRPRMAANLRARSEAVRAMRETLDDLGFLEVETPTLIRSTPEGARDMLVPSRLSKGAFYALPQSPQLFKQLLMVGGVDRYYQIARCYRDEDLRSDRQLEFTQLDIEGAFWGQEDVLDTLEQVIVSVVERARGETVSRPFKRLTYADSMDRYGTDKPDLRFGMEIIDLSEAVASSDFRAFSGALADGGVVRGINAGPIGLSRSGLDGLVARAQELGGKGLVWMVAEDDGSLRSPVAKFLSEAELSNLVARLEAKPGDTLLIAADEGRVVGAVLGQLRLDLGRPQGHDELSFLWIVDFPVFEETEGGDLAPAHHPFTSPLSVEEMRDNPKEAISKAYDLVLNGSELGSGSVRIHDPEIQKQVFEILGISDEEAESRFGWFIKALRFGTPPHAGFAVGIDRLLAILQGEQSIRDVIPFPKTQTGTDPLTESPTIVDDFQLMELGVDLRPDVRAALLAEEDET